MNTIRKRTIRIAAVVAAAVVLTGGCSDDASVGSGVEVGGGGGPGALRDQATTTVPADGQAAPPTTARQGPAPTQPADQGSQGQTTQDTEPPAVTEDTQPPETTTTRAAQVTLIKITDAGTSFDPVIAQAGAGTKVKWENTGSAPRQVADRDNKYFLSPMIDPGQSYTWTVTVPAGTTINYRDTTRPYAQAAKIEIY